MSIASGAPRVVVIANPASGRGEGARVLPQLTALLDAALGPDHGALQLTERAGHETTLARAAANAGARTIVAVGGDGTWGNVVRGIMTSGAEVRPRLALIAAGTGNDLAHAAALPASNLRTALAVALADRERAIDVGEVDGVHFVNCAGFGFDAAVLQESQHVRLLRGHAVYLATAARLLMGYRGFAASVDGSLGAGGNVAEDHGAAGRPPLQHYLMLVVANGPRFGGGFRIAPDARIDDGALDLVEIRDVSPLRRAVLFARAVRGTHVTAPEVRLRAVHDLVLRFDAPPLVDLDGELHQARTSTLTVRCHRAALRLAVP